MSLPLSSTPRKIPNAGTAKDFKAAARGKFKQVKKDKAEEVINVDMEAGSDPNPRLNKAKGSPSSPEQSKAKKAKVSGQAAKSGKKSLGRPAKAKPQLVSPHRGGRRTEGSPEAETTSQGNADGVSPSDRPGEQEGKPAVAARKSGGVKGVKLKKPGLAGTKSVYISRQSCNTEQIV